MLHERADWTNGDRDVADRLERLLYPERFDEGETYTWDPLTDLIEEIGVLASLSPSPSVRLARWEDGHPERLSQTVRVSFDQFRTMLIFQGGAALTGEGATRDEAKAAALDLAEAGATTEGERDAG